MARVCAAQTAVCVYVLVSGGKRSLSGAQTKST